MTYDEQMRLILVPILVVGIRTAWHLYKQSLISRHAESGSGGDWPGLAYYLGQRIGISWTRFCGKTHKRPLNSRRVERTTGEQ